MFNLFTFDLLGKTTTLLLTAGPLNTHMAQCVITTSTCSCLALFQGSPLEYAYVKLLQVNEGGSFWLSIDGDQYCYALIINMCVHTFVLTGNKCVIIGICVILSQAYVWSYHLHMCDLICNICRKANLQTLHVNIVSSHKTTTIHRSK